MKHLLPEMTLPLSIIVSGSVFFLLFIGIVVYAYSKGRKATYERAGTLPLEDGIVGSEKKKEQV